MASIEKSFSVDTSADAAWDAFRDFGALHRRLVPGFVSDARLDGDARIVTFANGQVARELLVSCDDQRRRLVYAIPPNDRITHYNAAVEVIPDGGNCRIRWTIDLLPHALEPMIAAQMELAVAAMRRTLAQPAA